MNGVTLTAAQLDTLRSMVGRVPGGHSCDLRVIRALLRKSCLEHDASQGRYQVTQLGRELVRRADERAEKREVSP